VRALVYCGTKHFEETPWQSTGKDQQQRILFHFLMKFILLYEEFLKNNSISHFNKTKLNAFPEPMK
jgi:hypothetical protein